MKLPVNCICSLKHITPYNTNTLFTTLDVVLQAPEELIFITNPHIADWWQSSRPVSNLYDLYIV